MKRKEVLTLAGGLIAAPTAASAALTSGAPLHPPAHGPVQVAFAVGPDLVPIDLFGPWAAFGSAFLGRVMTMGEPLFNTYAVGPATAPLDQGGLSIEPQYNFDTAPQPHVVVVPMQRMLPATITWVKRTAVRADLTMSICTGAFLVAKAGLFDGHKATTHHDAYDEFAKRYPKVDLIRGPRYVEDRRVASSGGESSGIDLALRVIERYYGTQAAKNAAYSMEYRRTPRPQSIDAV